LENGNISSQDSLLDLDYYSTVEELIEVGPEKLKEVKSPLFSLFLFLAFSKSNLNCACVGWNQNILLSACS